LHLGAEYTYSANKNQLTELPKEIGNLTNLEYLDLSYNRLTTLPKELENLKNLAYLYLTGNNFSEKEKAKISSCFEGTNCSISW